MSIQFITPTPGPTTTEKIIEILQNHPEGVTARIISQSIYRPISMVQICLKNSLTLGLIYIKKNGVNEAPLYCLKKFS